MPTNVMMPQMGESIAEGTIVRWIKKVGDAVERDEPLFEISTDKVDAEIPAPSAGVLLDIKVKEGETVPVNSVVAVIGAAEEKAAAAPQPTSNAVPAGAVGQPDTGEVRRQPDATTEDAATEGPTTEAVRLKPDITAEGEGTIDDLRRQKSSPLVRRIAREHDVDIRLIKGTGISGRVTKRDIMGYIESGARQPAPAAAPVPAPVPAPAPAPRPAAAPAAVPVAAFKPGENVRIEPMSVMRKKIAEHMVISARTSPHVYSVYEVNFARVTALRDRKKAEYEASGARLTYTAFIARAIVEALRTFPYVNASLDGDNIVYKRDVNLGIAVALDNGLIVPVIKNAHEKNLFGLSRAIEDLATRARTKKLNPDDVQGGTFTITNPGVFGALYGLPLINQPQVAILGVGAIEKRPIVVDDAIAIRPVCHLTLGYDHRLIDGADAGRFLSFLKERLENFEDAWM